MAGVEDFLVDFNKEDKSGGGRFKVPEGKYPVEIKGAKPTVSGQKKTPGLELTLKITEGPRKGKVFKETLWATPKAYSRFRGLLEAVGIRVPQKLSLVKLSEKLPGMTLVVELEDEIDENKKYKPRSRVSFEGFINEEDYDPDEDAPEDDGEEDEEDEDEDEDVEDEEEEEPAPKPKAKKKKAKAKPVEDDEDDEDDLDLDEL
jgi:hypothetical protein